MTIPPGVEHVRLVTDNPTIKRPAREKALAAAGWVRVGLNCWHRPADDLRLFSLAAAYHTMNQESEGERR